MPALAMTQETIIVRELAIAGVDDSSLAEEIIIVEIAVIVPAAAEESAIVRKDDSSAAEATPVPAPVARIVTVDKLATLLIEVMPSSPSVTILANCCHR
jgi:hypothetical protein